MLLQFVLLCGLCNVLVLFPFAMASNTSLLERGKAAAKSSLDAEAYPVTPAGLVLEQVHLYVRHGK